MAYDLLFRKRTPRNLARKPTVKVSSTESLVLTEPEKAMLARIAHCRAKAQAGDKQARKDWGKTVKQIVATRRQAARGNVKAQRAVAVLVQSGMFPSKKKLASKATPGALKPLISGVGADDFATALAWWNGMVAAVTSKTSLLDKDEKAAVARNQPLVKAALDKNDKKEATRIINAFHSDFSYQRRHPSLF